MMSLQTLMDLPAQNGWIRVIHCTGPPALTLQAQIFLLKLFRPYKKDVLINVAAEGSHSAHPISFPDESRAEHKSSLVLLSLFPVF